MIFTRIRTVLDQLTMALNVMGTLLIVAVMLLVNADVIGRAAFDKPISGVPEIVSMSIVAIVFLQIAQTFRLGRLTRSDALPGFIARRSIRGRAALEVLFCTGAIAIMWQLLSASYPLYLKSWIRKTYEGTIGDFTAPIWPVKLVILIGCTALLLQLLAATVIALRTVWTGTQSDFHAADSSHSISAPATKPE